jgi:dihydroxyacetone kinase-like predicted kinase
MGDSVLVVGDTHTVKVHVHTDEPGTPLNYLARLGQIDRIIVENMQLQFEQFVQSGGPTAETGSPMAVQRGISSPASLMPVPDISGPIGTVVVSSGEGLDRVFRSLGAGALVHGGQTMNPSTQELLEAIDSLPVDDVIVFPNNKNIILAAEQARDLASKRVRVVKSKTIPQGIAAMLTLNQQQDLDTNVAQMTAALPGIQTGEVTVAVRDVSLGNMEVGEGDFIGLLDDELVACGDTPRDVVLQLLNSMEAEESEIITMYRGEPLSTEDATALEAELLERYPDQEIEILDGGQKHYHYIFSVE